MKSIKDYKGKSQYAIQCHSQEEWNAICELLGKDLKEHWKRPVSGTSTDTISTGVNGWGGRSLFTSETILQASEFLILPDRWKLDIDILTEEQKAVAEAYWEQYPNVDNKMDFKGYLLSEDGSRDASYMNWGYGDGYIEISFEQFNRRVAQPSMVHAVVPPDEIVVNQFPIY
jgi:hypothetical protein